MKKQILFIAFLFFVGAGASFAQFGGQRDPTQIRAETSRRNKAVENPDNNPFNHTNPTAGTGRFLNTGKIPGSAVRGYVLAAQAKTEVTVVTVGDGDKLLVDDGTNKVVVRILGVDAPEKGQPQYEEAKRNLNDLVAGKRVTLIYSLHNLKDEAGYFPARIFLGATDVGLSLLENGFAWRSEADKFFFEKKDDAKNKQAEAKAHAAKAGIWTDEEPQTPWEYRKRKLKELRKAKEKAEKK